MPTQGVVNYLPVLSRVLSHWANVEAGLGKAVVLPNKTTLDAAKDLAARLLTIETVLTNERNVLSAAQMTRETVREAIHTAAKQARKSLRGQASNVAEVAGLPNLPVISTAAAKLLTIYTDIASVWEQVNALPPARVPAATLPLHIPLTENTVLVSLDLAGFKGRIEAFRGATETVRDKEATVTVKIGERNTLHKEAAKLIKDYATLVRGLLPDGHPLLKTIPTLTG